MDKLKLKEKKEQQRKVVVTLRLPNELHEKVTELANSQNVRKSDVYRSIISLFFADSGYKM